MWIATYFRGATAPRLDHRRVGKSIYINSINDYMMPRVCDLPGLSRIGISVHDDVEYLATWSQC